LGQTRILIADDHEIFRKGVRSLLDTCPQWEICGEASNGVEAVEKARKLAPDIVIMDLSMPQINGLDAMKQILREIPKTRVVILTQHDSAYMFAAAMNAGALAYVTKSQVARYLLEALESVAAGKRFGWGGDLTAPAANFPETNLKSQTE
jgi:DNA-binding NarL/FixJ family response regulator